MHLYHFLSQLCRIPYNYCRKLLHGGDGTAAECFAMPVVFVPNRAVRLTVDFSLFQDFSEVGAGTGVLFLSSSRRVSSRSPIFVSGFTYFIKNQMDHWGDAVEDSCVEIHQNHKFHRL